MDAFARLAPVVVELLDRVDRVLATVGAPADHPVWPLLRRLRALPGEAVGAFAAATPGSLATAGETLDALAEEYRRLRAHLPAEAGWRGAGADSFAVRWRALCAHLDGDLADRVRTTASFLDAVEAWQAESREALARTLGTVLSSAEAVSVCTAADPVDAAPAAADIAATVLAELVAAYQRGEQVLAGAAPRLAEVAYRAPVADGPTDRDATTEVIV